MAKLEVSFPYKTVSHPVAGACCLAWALFGLWLVPHVAGLLTVLTAGVNPAISFYIYMAVVLCTAALYTYVPFRLVSASMQGGYISANEEGLGTPDALFTNAKFRPWSSLKVAEVVDGRIVLDFSSTDVVAIDTKQLSKNKLEQFLLALEVWGHKAVLANSLIEMRDHLQNEKIGIEDHNYTKMWEEELNRRFNATTFVPLEPGHHLRSDSLTVIKQLAFGGFSAVYLAEDTQRNQVVIKESVTSTEPGADTRAIEFFHREAQFLSGLEHPQIARVLDNFVENGRNYIVLDYISGENLRELVRRKGALDERLVAELMIQMADVLSYLHIQNPPIIHRDFTPDNLVLRNDGSLFVIDFGAANEYVGSATGTLIGKQCYMPPEQVRGKSEPCTDLYALGCTAAFLITGKDPEALSVCHPKQVNANLSDSLNDLIEQLTQQESRKRLQTAAELKTRLIVFYGDIQQQESSTSPH